MAETSTQLTLIKKPSLCETLYGKAITNITYGARRLDIALSREETGVLEVYEVYYKVPRDLATAAIVAHSDRDNRLKLVKLLWPTDFYEKCKV